MILRGLTHALDMDVKVAGFLLLPDTLQSSIIGWDASACNGVFLVHISRRSMGLLAWY